MFFFYQSIQNGASVIGICFVHGFNKEETQSSYDTSNILAAPESKPSERMNVHWKYSVHSFY